MYKKLCGYHARIPPGTFLQACYTMSHLMFWLYSACKRHNSWDPQAQWQTRWRMVKGIESKLRMVLCSLNCWIIYITTSHRPTLRTSPSLFASTARELLWLNVTSHSGNGALVHTSMNFNVTLQCDHLAQTVSLCQNCDKPTCSVPLWPYHGKSAQQTSKEKERYSTWTYNFYQMFIIFRSAYSSVRAWLPHLNEDEGSSLREAFQEFSAIHIC